MELDVFRKKNWYEYWRIIACGHRRISDRHAIRLKTLNSAPHTGVPLGATVPEGMGFKDHISRAENIEK